MDYSKTDSLTGFVDFLNSQPVDAMMASVDVGITLVMINHVVGTRRIIPKLK